MGRSVRSNVESTPLPGKTAVDDAPLYAARSRFAVDPTAMLTPELRAAPFSSEKDRDLPCYCVLPAAWTANIPPCGSWQFAIRPPPGTSIGPLRIFPPFFVTRSAA